MSIENIPIKFNTLNEIKELYPQSYFMPSKDYCIIIPELSSSYTYRIDKKSNFKKEEIFIGKERFKNDKINLPRTKILSIAESLYFGYKTVEEVLKEYKLPLSDINKNESWIISDNVFFIYIRKPFLPTSNKYNVCFKGFFNNSNPLFRTDINTNNIKQVEAFYLKDGKGPDWLMKQIKSQSFRLFSKDINYK